MRQSIIASSQHIFFASCGSVMQVCNTKLILKFQKTRKKKVPKILPTKSNKFEILITSFLYRNFCQISSRFYQPTFDERYFRSRTSTSFRKLDGHRRLCTWNSNFGGYLISKRSVLAISYWISNLPHLNCKCLGNRHIILCRIYVIGTTYVRNCNLGNNS